jgi:hypothetical protein
MAQNETVAAGTVAAEPTTQKMFKKFSKNS